MVVHEESETEIRLNLQGVMCATTHLPVPRLISKTLEK